MGQLSKAQLARYARQILAPDAVQLNVRRHVQLGREPEGYVDVTDPNPRAGPNTTLKVTAGLTELRVDGESVELLPPFLSKAAEAETGSGQMSYRLPLSAAGERAGRVPIEAEVELALLPSMGGKPVVQAITGGPLHVGTEVIVGEAYTGDYLRDELPAAHQAPRAGVWIEAGGSNSQQRNLVLAVVDQPDRVKVNVWIRAGSLVVRLRPERQRWGDRNHGKHYLFARWSLTELFKDHPGLKDATHVDVIVRPNIKEAETRVTPPKLWLGEWVFEDVPLTAAPLGQHDSFTGIPSLPKPGDLPTLVAAKARLLTIEQADQPPSPVDPVSHSPQNEP